MPDPYINNTGLRTYTAQTVASLGAASANNAGLKFYVNDSTVNNEVGQNLTAVGGGTYQAYVRSNGAAWKIA